MRSLYRPGNSFLHRIPAGWKLLALAACLVLVTVQQRNVIAIGLELISVVSLYLLAGVSVGEFLTQLWKLKTLVLVIFVPQIFFAGLEQGLANTSVLIIGVLLATLLSITTKTSDLVAVVLKLTKSQSFALLIALSINALAQVAAISASIVEAGKARGVKISPVRQITSLFVVALRNADNQTEALAARGVSV